MDTNDTVTSNNSYPDSVVVATEVTDPEARLRCLPKIAGNLCVVLEHTIYDMMSRLADAYNGGFWNYYTLSNGGFYMAPHVEKSFHLSCENMFEGEACADTAGIIATAMAYSHLSFLSDGECFAVAYDQLRDYIGAHPDADIIFAALD